MIPQRRQIQHHLGRPSFEIRHLLLTPLLQPGSFELSLKPAPVFLQI
jgi:hypothetical protein